MELNTNESWFIGLVGAVIAFFFGKSGILQKWTDYFIGFRTKKFESESTEIEKRDKQIEELKEQVDELKDVISKLDKDLVKTTTYVKTLLAYLETLMPEGANPFIIEMAKEIRGNGQNK